ncbi:unnamed protein product [Linum tenue]|uniref:Uncharacterized protein n=3 Tax=Linum tenue TaxID=586396 RepID=A0AAV0N7V1_9ROSI|nr:unnamed protein product [Linum tenue]
MVTNEVRSGDDEAVIADKLRLIDAVQRLGVGYHFEAEIEAILEKVHDMGEVLFANIDDKDTNLYHAALRFRLLRQQGFPTSPDEFKKLKNSDGRFKEWLSRDVQGLLSLYEAAHMAFNGEDILDEALSFATKSLKSIGLPTQEKISPSFQKQIDFALRLPAWKCPSRSLARHSIDNFYSEDSALNQNLLTFAKLDFNMVQSFHQQELRELSNWWRSIDVTTNFPYARDRLVESYYVFNCAYFEPKYGQGRIMGTKIFLVVTILDDTIDNFATFEELRALVEAIDERDVRALHELPDRVKNVYRVIRDLYTEIESEIGKTGPTFGVEYAKGELKKLAQFWLDEARCYSKGQFPTLEKYFIDACVTGGIPKLCASAFVGMGAETATREAFEWIANRSKMVKAASFIGRLQNDICSHKFEQKRNHWPSAIECYIKEYGVSEVEAVEFLWKVISKLWKDIAEEYCQKPIQLPYTLTNRLLNLTRCANIVYEKDDYITHSHLLKDHLSSLFIHPVPL